MLSYLLVKYAHIIGASVLFGTGVGIAFFMWLAHRSGSVPIIAGVARIVVVADYLFTATAVVLQPITGVMLIRIVGYSITEGWIVLSLLLYVIVGLFWLPVVRMQIRMRDLAVAAAKSGEALPAEYYALFRKWFAFGFPAFGSVLVIFWLMIARPSISLP